VTLPGQPSAREYSEKYPCKAFNSLRSSIIWFLLSHLHRSSIWRVTPRLFRRIQVTFVMHRSLGRNQGEKLVLKDLPDRQPPTAVRGACPNYPETHPSCSILSHQPTAWQDTDTSPAQAERVVSVIVRLLRCYAGMAPGESPRHRLVSRRPLSTRQ
jgi:hypothetical protein